MRTLASMRVACRVFDTWTKALEAAGIVVEDKSCGAPAKGLKRLRLQRGLSQAALAQKVGSVQNHISNLENLHIYPTKTMLVALAHSLNIGLAALLN